ncbi:response regulator transcription factor [Actinoallomurus sp. CA-150999]|uniref:response regulator transcription factor n=1 Tax=Actinoallomurus sp. CA-150999 TaxID=3239887 RepID=UPI003D91DDC2
MQVVQLVAEGLNNRQIAARLSVSGATIDTYLSRIFAKLGVTSRAAIVSAVTGHGSEAPHPNR